MRLVLLNNTNKTLSVYNDRVCLAIYEIEDPEIVNKETILELLTSNYDEKA